MSRGAPARLPPAADPPRKELTVELVDTCNLHCSYCVRDDRQLYGKMHALPVDLLDRALGEAKSAWGPVFVGFTGGEPTLHPEFEKVLGVVAKHGLRANFVTNAWHFEKVAPFVARYRSAISEVAFSLDGATAEAHDKWRGKGSFARVLRALELCVDMRVPSIFKIVLRKDTVSQLEDFCTLASQTAASEIIAGPFFPTTAADQALLCGAGEQVDALRELARLRRHTRIRISIAAGFYDPRPEPTCRPLGGQSANIDFQGRLSLCCVLSGFRGGAGDDDVVGSLHDSPFESAAARLPAKVSAMNARREREFAGLRREDAPLSLGSACLHCLNSFGKSNLPFVAESVLDLPIVADDRFVLGKGYIFRKSSDGKASVLDFFFRNEMTLNETAAVIVERFLAGDDAKGAAEVLSDEFAVGRDKALSAVMATARDLRRRGLLRPDVLQTP